MNKKKIIGLIGNQNLVKIISSKLEKNGFKKLSICNKVKEIASFILSKDEIEKENIIKKFREKAYLINRWYWINLLLSSVPEKCQSIVIDDLQEEDVVPNVIDVYRISESNIEEISKEIFQ